MKTMKRIDDTIRNMDVVFLLGICIFVISFIFGIASYVRVHGNFNMLIFLQDFYANITAELGSIAITVVIVDQLARHRDRYEAELNELVVQLRNQDTRIVQSSVTRLRNQGWLTDGGLQGTILFKANLQNANLYNANLARVGLQFANLSGVNLGGANLSGADLTEADLTEADLSGANLSGADLTEADLSGANLKTANLEGAIINKTTRFDEKTVLPDAELFEDEQGNSIYDTYWSSETDMRRYTDPEHPEFWRREES